MSNVLPHRSRLGVFATGAFVASAVAWLVVQVAGTPTVGWWKPLVIPAFVVAIPLLALSVGGPLNVVHQDGGYFFSNHGDLTPATLRDFQESEASLAGLFSSMALLFNGIGALTLTQVRPSGGATAPRFRPPTGRRRQRG